MGWRGSGGAVAAGVGGSWWLSWLVAVGFSVHEVPSEKSARVVSVAWSVIIGGSGWGNLVVPHETMKCDCDLYHI
ncbi:neuraminidase [Mobiluncus mulieris]|nr:neuraminidase [Mobiluncus mulieris]